MEADEPAEDRPLILNWSLSIRDNDWKPAP